LPTDEKCKDTDAFAFITDVATGECFGVTADDDKIDTTATELRDDDGAVNGVSLKYLGGKHTCLTDET
jgi:hypothetical protein